jgi:hypothetical protein
LVVVQFCRPGYCCGGALGEVGGSGVPCRCCRERFATISPAVAVLEELEAMSDEELAVKLEAMSDPGE